MILFRILICSLLLNVAMPATAQDAINLALAVNHGPIMDVADWPATKTITKITVDPSRGWAFDGTFREWPDYLAFGNDGYLQYTVWPVVRIAGEWHMAGEVQMWRDRPSTGGFGEPTWHDDFPTNWGYNAGVMGLYHPNPGDQMGFFVTAGNGRVGQVTGVTSVRERSNVVLVTLPVNDTGAWTFPATSPPIEPPPPPIDPLPPPPIDDDDLDALLELIGGLDAKLSAIQAQQAKDREDVLTLVRELTTTVEDQQPSQTMSILKNVLLFLASLGAGIGAAK